MWESVIFSSEKDMIFIIDIHTYQKLCTFLIISIWEDDGYWKLQKHVTDKCMELLSLYFAWS